MTKWDYIRFISQKGTRYGSNGGVFDLLQWCGKLNTSQVTLQEAEAFWKMYHQEDIQPSKSEGK